MVAYRGKEIWGWSRWDGEDHAIPIGCLGERRQDDKGRDQGRSGRNKHKKKKTEDERVQSHVSRQPMSSFFRALCLMATVCCVFLLKPTSNSVLGERAPSLELVQVQTAGDLEVGQASGGTWTAMPPPQGEHAWGGGTGQGQQLQKPTVSACARTTSKLQVGEAGK